MYILVNGAGEPESPRVHIAKFYGQRRLIRSVLRASTFSLFKLNWNCNSVGLLRTQSLLASACFVAYGSFLFNFKNYWLRITYEDSVPEMHSLSILLIKYYLKWCIRLSRSLFLFFSYLVRVTSVGPKSSQGHTQPSSAVDVGRFVTFWDHQIFPWLTCLKLIEIVILWVYYTIPLAPACVCTFGLHFLIFSVWQG